MDTPSQFVFHGKSEPLILGSPCEHRTPPVSRRKNFPLTDDSPSKP